MLCGFQDQGCYYTIQFLKYGIWYAVKKNRRKKQKGKIFMIKTRLVGLLSHAKKYIVYTILWQWAALLSQVLAVFSIADLLERVVYRAVTVPIIERTILILVLVVVIRFICERMEARSSYLACMDVKRILREKIYEKMLKLGASYSEQVSSSEVVQVSTESECDPADLCTANPDFYRGGTESGEKIIK